MAAKASARRRAKIYTKHPCGGDKESHRWDRWWTCHQFDLLCDTHQHDLLLELFGRVRRAWRKRLRLRGRLDRHWKVERKTEKGVIRWESDRYDLEDEIIRLNFEIQVSADSFVLMLAKDLDALRIGTGLDVRRFGHEVSAGVSIARAIWALGNRVRHAHEWAETSGPKDKATRQVLDMLPGGEDDDASAQFLMWLNLSAYKQLKTLLLSVAEDAVAALNRGEAENYAPPICIHDIPNPGGSVLFDYRECRTVDARGVVVTKPLRSGFSIAS